MINWLFWERSATDAVTFFQFSKLFRLQCTIQVVNFAHRQHHKHNQQHSIPQVGHQQISHLQIMNVSMQTASQSALRIQQQQFLLIYTMVVCISLLIRFPLYRHLFTNKTVKALTALSNDEFLFAQVHITSFFGVLMLYCFFGTRTSLFQPRCHKRHQQNSRGPQIHITNSIPNTALCAAIDKKVCL